MTKSDRLNESLTDLLTESDSLINEISFNTNTNTDWGDKL